MFWLILIIGALVTHLATDAGSAGYYLGLGLTFLLAIAAKAAATSTGGKASHGAAAPTRKTGNGANPPEPPKLDPPDHLQDSSFDWGKVKLFIMLFAPVVLGVAALSMFAPAGDHETAPILDRESGGETPYRDSAQCLERTFPPELGGAADVPPGLVQYCAHAWNAEVIERVGEILSAHDLTVGRVNPRWADETDQVALYHGELVSFWTVANVLPFVHAMTLGEGWKRQVRQIVSAEVYRDLAAAAGEISWRDDPTIDRIPTRYSIAGGHLYFITDQLQIRSLADLAEALRDSSRLREQLAASPLFQHEADQAATWLLTPARTAQLVNLSVVVGAYFASRSAFAYPRAHEIDTTSPFELAYVGRSYPSSCPTPHNRPAFFCQSDRRLIVLADRANHAAVLDGYNMDEPLALPSPLYHELAHVIFDPPRPHLSPLVAEGRATAAAERWRRNTLAAAAMRGNRDAGAAGIAMWNDPQAAMAKATASDFDLQRRALRTLALTRFQRNAICAVAARPLAFEEVNREIGLSSTAFADRTTEQVRRAYQVAWALFEFGTEPGEGRIDERDSLDVRPLRVLAERRAANQPLPPPLVEQVRIYIDHVNDRIAAERRSRNLGCGRTS